jgi:dynein axonemal light intermediate chain 1
MSGPQKHGLVKYDAPQLVEDKSGAGTAAPEKDAFTRSIARQRQVSKVAAAAKRGQGDASPSQVEDILSAILPPREWVQEDTGALWRQKVSSQPSTRQEVITLQQNLDNLLEQKKARRTGIDPVRQELYAQAFDEIIRQVTVNCSERGLLLLRVRDEINMTVGAYQTLYESAVAWGMRKALESEQGKTGLEETIERLEIEKSELTREVRDLKSKCEFIEKRENERRAHDEKKHNDEVVFLKRQNQQLKAQLEAMMKKA